MKEDGTSSGKLLQHSWSTAGALLEHPGTLLKHARNTAGTLGATLLEHPWNTARTPLKMKGDEGG